ncbi:MAG TPA: hypothetical protein VMC42_02350 [Methanoregulaceae archaeon]|nr:hypothetical protein [Methanoregulaceae archaeon]
MGAKALIITTGRYLAGIKARYLISLQMPAGSGKAGNILMNDRSQVV